MLEEITNCEEKKEKKGKKPKILSGFRLYGYSAGILGQILPFSFTSALLMIYFVYTIGLNPILVSVGTSMGFIVNAIGAPLSGIVADKIKPNKFGKRKSLLIIGLPAFSFSFIFIWISKK